MTAQRLYSTLYKGQYAAIDIIPENDVSFEVQFRRDRRTQNMILLADDEKVVEVQGSNEGSVETIMMTAEENDTVKFTYDSDSGDIAMEAKYDEESYDFAGNLAVDKNRMVITIDDLGNDSEDVSGSITWEKRCPVWRKFPAMSLTLEMQLKRNGRIFFMKSLQQC